MRLFVTAAQEAALHLAHAARVAEQWAREYERVTAAHAAEIARLREDRREELARLADPSAPFLAHLLELVAILRRDVVHERQRAEVAIDQCRAMHQGIGPVTLPPRAETLAQDRGTPSAFTDPELAQMGNPDGL